MGGGQGRRVEIVIYNGKSQGSTLEQKAGVGSWTPSTSVMALPIHRSGQLPFHQPVVEPTVFQFKDAVLNFAQMTLFDLGELLAFCC